MDSARWQQIEKLYSAAVACEPSQRSRLLDQADPDIKREVEQMLSQSGSLLDQPAWQDSQADTGAERPSNRSGARDGSAERGSAVPANSSDAQPTATIAAPGATFGPYVIEERLGAGGMGEVFRARDTRLGRKVAIKTSNDRFSARFETEARAISALNHPHICTVYDVGPNYLVMELVEGETLAARLKRGPIPLVEALRFGAQIAVALADAHAHHIVHRDLKPSNIMLTRHGVKVLDFGLARMLTETGVTASHVVMGTPAYMAPEQVEGKEPSSATDLFSVGLLLYEMAVGKLPFPGVSLGQMLSIGSAGPNPHPSLPGTECPPELTGLIGSLLEKDPAQRPQSAAEIARTLTALADKIENPPASRRRPAFTLAAIVAVLMAAAGIWLYRDMEQHRWAREVAIPQAAKIAQDQPLAAYLLLQQAARILPGDPQIAALEKSSTQPISVQSNPAGARVEIQDYVKPGDWFALGSTPLTNVTVPKGYFRWKLSAPGQSDFISAPPTVPAMQFDLAAVGHAASGMVPVPGGPTGEFVDFVGWLIGNLPAYDIGKFEVTNAQYQAFVDQGGYRKPEYWKEKFVKDGKELTWQQAMDLLRDSTGRPGPSSWEGGHFPQGHADDPVGGVSWYEAEAYASYAGQSLPVILQWYKAAPSDLAPYAVGVSNFDRKGPVPVGSLPSVGPYGAYDMAGNVREWTHTAEQDSRFTLGGAWATQTYASFDPASLPPFDRSLYNGFRTVRNKQPLSAELTAPLVPHGRDFSKEKPVSDEVFQAYKAIYAYDQKPLDPVAGPVVEDTPDWTKQKVVIDAGYEGKRLDMYLFLPKKVHPPYQAVLFFPSARVELMTDSRSLGDMQFVDYVIKSGRALLYPIYNGTYERVNRALVSVGSSDDLQLTVQRSKEVRRGLDYLQTRPDVDASRIAYLGVSMGTAYGVVFTALEDRFRVIIFLDGGFFLLPPPRGRDQLDFAPHVTKPVLMVNGKYDFSFSLERAQNPLFRLLGTPPEQKRHVVLETPHDVSEQKDILSKEVLAWLDKYLGRVS